MFVAFFSSSSSYLQDTIILLIRFIYSTCMHVRQSFSVCVYMCVNNNVILYLEVVALVVVVAAVLDDAAFLSGCLL